MRIAINRCAPFFGGHRPIDEANALSLGRPNLRGQSCEFEGLAARRNATSDRHSGRVAVPVPFPRSRQTEGGGVRVGVDKIARRRELHPARKTPALNCCKCYLRHLFQEHINFGAEAQDYFLFLSPLCVKV